MTEDHDSSAPGLGEIGRIVLKTDAAISDLRRELAESYVRKDVWQIAETNAGIRVGEVSKDVTDLKVTIERLVNLREADRRLILTALIAPVITAVTAGLILVLVQRTLQ